MPEPFPIDRTKPANALERDRQELLPLAERLLSAAFAELLPAAQLQERLHQVSKIRLLGGSAYRLASRLNSGLVATDGVMLEQFLPPNSSTPGRVQRDPSRAITLHRLLYLGTRLMSPPSVKRDDETHYRYLGPLRLVCRTDTSEVDVAASRIPDHDVRVLFWQAVTAWHADYCLKEAFTEQQKREVEMTGYPQRLLIKYLVEHCPDQKAFIFALRKAYVSGSEAPVHTELEEMCCLPRGWSGANLLKKLLEALKPNKRDWEQHFQHWQSVVDHFFKPPSS